MRKIYEISNQLNGNQNRDNSLEYNEPKGNEFRKREICRNEISAIQQNVRSARTLVSSLLKKGFPDPSKEIQTSLASKNSRSIAEVNSIASVARAEVLNEEFHWSLTSRLQNDIWNSSAIQFVI